MATVINKKDSLIQGASPRTVSVDLGGTVNVTGTISGIPAQDIVDAATSATSNFFTSSAVDPTGGNDGDAHFNTATFVMWFKINSVWQRGGTVNASQVTTGTLAAARIAANSITADKINVSTLSAVSANLGSVTAGDITGTANIAVTGTGRFNGSTPQSGVNNAVVANNSRAQLNGVLAFDGSATGGAAVGAVSASVDGIGVETSASGVGGKGISASALSSSGVNGVGVEAIGLGSSTALSVFGTMKITSTTLVNNLNAEYVGGNQAVALAKVAGGNSFSGGQFFAGNVDVSGFLQCNNFRIDQTLLTGSGTATFPGNNKPGGSSTCTWLQIDVLGATKYIPVWS